MGFHNSQCIRYPDDLLSFVILEFYCFHDSVACLHLSLLFRIKDDLEESGNAAYKTAKYNRRNYWKGVEVFEKTGKSLKAKVLSRVFSEDYENVNKNLIFDPDGQAVCQWSKILIVASLVSVFVDPLFFFLPIVREEGCIDKGSRTLATILTIIRTIGDIFYMFQIFVRFHTAYIAPSSRVFGRGEFVIDPSRIASRYLRKGFWLDLIAALPVPQVWPFNFHGVVLSVVMHFS